MSRTPSGHDALVIVPVLTALLLLVGAPPTDDVLAGLRQDPLFVSPTSSITPDRAVVRDALARTRVPLYVAVVAQEQVDATELGIDGLMLALVDRLADPRAVVLVVSDEGELQAGEGGSSGVDAAAALDRVLTQRLDQPFGSATLTGAIVDLAALVGPREVRVVEGSTRRTVGLVGLVTVVAIGGGGLLYARSQRRLRAGAPLTDEAAPTAAGWH